MIIEKLRLLGATGIKRGLGFDEVEIDFRAVSGLIAMQGSNGSGKTSCLEALSPYPQLASREGSLAHHFYLRKSEKELLFKFAGDQYRTLLKIDSQNERSEGYIWKNGHSEITGKISEYSKYIKNLLGSPELFFNSVFCPQNSKKLSDLTTGELKRLFAEFLRLDRLQNFEETAKQVGNILGGKVSQIDIRRASLTDRLAGIEKLKQDQEAMGLKLWELEQKKDHTLLEMRMLRESIEELKRKVSDNAVVLTKKQAIQAGIVRLEKEMKKAKAEAESELEAVRSRYRALTAGIGNCDLILKDREKILVAAEQEQVTSAQIERLTPMIEKVQEERAKNQETAHGLEKQIQGLKQTVKDLENDREVRDLERQLQTLEKQAQTYDLKDPACQSSTCSFIVEAIKAIEEIPKITKGLGKRTAWVESAKKMAQQELGRSQELFEEIQKATNKGKNFLNHDRQTLASLRLELGKLKDLSAKKPEIQIAEARKLDFEAQLAETWGDGKQLKATWDEREQGMRAEIESAKAELAETEAAIDTQAETELSTVKTKLDQAEKNTFPDLEAKILEAVKREAEIKAELSRMAEAEAELATVEQERGVIQTDISEWLYLKAACGKNGLQAMEIDAAAPMISEYANNLLAKAFGPLFSVNFRTQDDEGREVLDIMVINENGDEDLLENKSGGEKTWILKALRLAMTLLSKEKSGRNFETFLSDEEDGALDVDNAKSFVRLYRACMDVGKFQSGIFISHKPQCRDMADHVLCFEPGKVPYWK